MPVLAPPAEDDRPRPKVCKCHLKLAGPNTYITRPDGNLQDTGKVQFYRCQVTGQKAEVIDQPIDPNT